MIFQRRTLAATAALLGALVSREAGAAPVTTHPRLWFTQADVQGLRAKAVTQNPLYANGLLPALTTALANYDNKLFPNGFPCGNMTQWDKGGTAFATHPLEAYAEFFAFMSLVDNSPTARIQHAQRARNLLMFVIDAADRGHQSGQPYRDPQFAVFDRSRWWGEAFGLTVDWIHDAVDANGKRILSANDRATIRRVFLMWADDDVNGYMHPTPVGVTDQSSLLTVSARTAANNYFSAHARNLILMSLALDEAEDPPVDPSKPVLELGNSLRSYFDNATGAWLYQQYAMYEQPDIVAQSYGLSSSFLPRLGNASGGMPVEGLLYGGESLGYVRETLLALSTAGYQDPSLIGPQAALADSGYWDRYLEGFLHSLAPVPVVNSSTQGPIYPVATYGDVLRQYVAADSMPPFGAMGLYDQRTGNTARLAASRWIVANAIEGGAGKLLSRVSGLWGNARVTQGILTFALFDPAESVASIPDPRPALSTEFTDPALGRLLVRTDWTANATWFDYKCSWTSINHQGGDCNMFELHRRGEWLTKEHSNYDTSSLGISSAYHNTLTLENDPMPGLTSTYENKMAQTGSQWRDGLSAGDPTTLTSIGTGYVFAQGDATNLYNHPHPWVPARNAMGIAHASRSLVWLEPDFIVVYDRATSISANRFKRFNLALTTNPSLSGRVAVETLASGQQLFIQSLAPAAGTMTAVPIEAMADCADGEPTRFRLVVEDLSEPADVRFLHVLQGADPNQPMETATSVQSTDGRYEGAVVHDTAVLFPKDLGPATTSLSYVVPALVDAHVVSGLLPSSGYDLTVQATSTGNLVSITSGGPHLTDAAGLLSVNLTDMISGLTPASLSFPASGGASQITVSALDDAGWTAVSNAPWITLVGTTGGSGDGEIDYQVASNDTGAPRTGTIVVGDQTFTVSQAAGTVSQAAATASCQAALTSISADVDNGASNGSVNVNQAAGCAWSAVSNDPWLGITSGASGDGAGSVGYAVQANTGAARTGTLTVAGLTFTVNQAQAAPVCQPSLAAPSADVDNGASNGSVNVDLAAGCVWTAVSNAPWISLTSDASGNGAGTVGFAVQPNTGALRTGTLTIAGLTFTIQQAAVASTCQPKLSLSSADVAANANTGNLTVNVAPGCPWSSVSNAPWLTVTSGATGSGTGNVGYAVQTNAGAFRTGTITIAGLTFTVNQLTASCTASLSAARNLLIAAGGTQTVSLSTGCGWSANSDSPWLTVTPSGGVGDAVLTFTAAPNTGATSRTGTLTIGGQTLSILQAASGGSGCVHALGSDTNPSFPDNLVVAHAGATGSVPVSAPGTCGFSAVSNVPWITVTAGGTSAGGGGTVQYTVAANAGGLRRGTLTIAGLTYEIVQL
ncbi:Serine/threonine kinase associate protein KapC [Minicystis rosea]|nr:Serine/threonine kinase associate protein KapC [Minicystis rosea]